ncbi:MAG: sulfurtransferase [Chloroflexota bacterium]|nr:sulfurtransferase [Chloroflexota bacterium]
MEFENPQYLVSTNWLGEHLHDEDVRVFESTVFLGFRDGGGYLIESGRAAYDAGHIPGAGFLDLQEDFSDNSQELRFMMPPAAEFAAAAGRHGISEQSKLILYDRVGTQWAARLWWMFRSMGCADAAVLDGGWVRWEAEGRPVSTDPANYPPTTFNPTPDPGRFADLEEIKEYLAADAGCLINALAPEQHSGADQGRRYGRAGHIPGSTNVPSIALIDRETALFRPPAELASMFAEAGAERDERVLLYCGGGIAASNDALVLTLLGYENVAVYDGSMSEYTKDPSLPLEIG